MPYLDVIRRIKDAYGAPTYAYQVSGEYAMLKCGAEWLGSMSVPACRKRCGVQAGGGGRRTDLFCARCGAIFYKLKPKLQSCVNLDWEAADMISTSTTWMANLIKLHSPRTVPDYV